MFTMKDIDFVKMSGSGNDFIVIDNRQDKITLRPEFIKEVCERKKSVGADGVLLLEKSDVSDLKMRIFNPDGREVEMCGNGARCVGLWAKQIISKPLIKIETKSGTIEAEVTAGERVKIKLGEVRDIKLNLELDLQGRTYKVNFINTGVPHAVIFIKEFPRDIKGVGGAIRHHKRFKPEGTNVDFVKIKSPDTISIRTYERGVEDETMACGTGAVAAAILAYHTSLVNKKQISVETKGGEVLKVYFECNGSFKNVWLEGQVRIVYKGKIRS